MEDGSPRMVNSDGINVESHTKKHKRKRVPVEESAGIVATVEETKPERKKRRTEKKKNGQTLQDSTGEISPQSESGTKNTTNIGPPGDTEPRPELKVEQITSKKTKKHKHQVPTIVDEPVHNTRQQTRSSADAVESGEPTDHKKVNTQHQDVTATGVAEIVHRTKKHKKKATTDFHGDQSYNTIVLESSKRKGKHKHKFVESTADPESTPGEEKQHKKRKHKDMNSKTAKAEISEPTEPLKLKKKKAKSLRQDNLFPNPSEDKKLTESALKALVYVYTRISSSSDWKFNKARQNWVVRNLWDDEAIPDAYFLSCVNYLADIQGNARDLLVKSGKSVLDSMPLQPDFDIKAVDKQKTSEGGQGADGGESSEEQLRRRQMRVKRAEVILAKLGVDHRPEK